MRQKTIGMKFSLPNYQAIKVASIQLWEYVRKLKFPKGKVSATVSILLTVLFSWWVGSSEWFQGLDFVKNWTQKTVIGTGDNVHGELYFFGFLGLCALVYWGYSVYSGKKQATINTDSKALPIKQTKEELEAQKESLKMWGYRIWIFATLLVFLALLSVKFPGLIEGTTVIDGKTPKVVGGFMNLEPLLQAVIAIVMIIMVAVPRKGVQFLLFWGSVILLSMIFWEKYQSEAKADDGKAPTAETSKVADKVADVSGIITVSYVAKPGEQGVIEIPPGRAWFISCPSGVWLLFDSPAFPQEKWHQCSEGELSVPGNAKRGMFYSGDDKTHKVLLKHGPVGTDPKKLR